MSDRWYVLDSGAGEPAWNMALDEALLLGAKGLGSPVLRFYSWKAPAATFGYFQQYADIERWTDLRPLIRRPTGGGLVPHASDWTYSIVIPPSHPWHRLKAAESYKRLHEWLQEAFKEVAAETELAGAAFSSCPGQCFAGAERFDLVWRGQKVAGAAQRRNKNGLLIQGSVQRQPPEIARLDWQAAMLAVGSRQNGADWLKLRLSNEILQGADRLVAEKYGRREYRQKR